MIDHTKQLQADQEDCFICRTIISIVYAPLGLMIVLGLVFAAA